MNKINYYFDDIAHIIHMCDGKANTINYQFLNEFKEIILNIDSVFPIILKGNNRIFSSGLDLHEVNSMDRQELQYFIIHFEELLMNLLKYPSPIVSLINGHAIAGGFIIACATDLRCAIQGDYLIGVNEHKIGISLPPLPYAIIQGKLNLNYRNIIDGGMLYKIYDFIPNDFFHYIDNKERLKRYCINILSKNNDIMIRKNEFLLWINNFYKKYSKNLMKDFFDSWFNPQTIQNRLDIEKNLSKT